MSDKSYISVKTTLDEDGREVLNDHLQNAIEELDGEVKWSHNGDASNVDDATVWDWFTVTIAVSGEDD